ncbi:hypothetical protein [Ramlibacter sp.]|uniref:hypothetical protein n=1 Tax=Ramlibacter sp. TaxID=1917967 RepID=UPI0026206F9B|nr:hypothetical protein [Ramlibacter sp.]
MMHRLRNALLLSQAAAREKLHAMERSNSVCLAALFVPRCACALDEGGPESRSGSLRCPILQGKTWSG